MPAPQSPGWFPQWRLPRPLRRAGLCGGGRGIGSADLPCSEVAVGCWAGGPQLCGLLEPGWEQPAPAWEQSRWSHSTWWAGWCPRGSVGHRAAGIRGWGALVSGRCPAKKGPTPSVPIIVTSSIAVSPPANPQSQVQAHPLCRRSMTLGGCLTQGLQVCTLTIQTANPNYVFLT